VLTYSSLPNPGTFQDLYVTLDTGKFYYWAAGGYWMDIGWLGITGSTGPHGPTGNVVGVSGYQGPTGPAGTGGGGGGGITTYFMNSSSALAPTINQSIRIIAGDYYNGDGTARPPRSASTPWLTIPTPGSINDYLNVEYMTSANFMGGATYLNVLFPSGSTGPQAAFTTTNYVWTYGTGTSTSNWIATTYAGSNTYYS
jgi:hypothetical protein